MRAHLSTIAIVGCGVVGFGCFGCGGGGDDGAPAAPAERDAAGTADAAVPEPIDTSGMQPIPTPGPPPILDATVADAMLDTMTLPDLAPETAESPDTAVADTAPVVDTGPPAVSVPTTPSALYSWLAAGNYKSWAHESTPHSSTGPHGAPVLVYINPAFEASLAAGSSEHPRGVAAVKELHSGGVVDGWAVSVKVESSSAGGNGWYWFEIYGTTNPSKALAGRGLPGCTGCHSLGKDYFRSLYPLR